MSERSERLERRYRRLLRLYPSGYREERGAEMIATLLEAAESGRARPARREVAALVVGALRTRTGLAAASSPGQLWLSALRVAVLLLVAHATAQSAARAGRIVFSELLMGREILATQWGHPAAFLAGGLALVAIARGRYGLGVLLTAVTFAIGEWAMSWLPFTIRLVDGGFWLLPLAMLLTLPLIWRPPAAPARSWAWLLAIPLALLVLPTDFDDTLRLQPFPLLIACAGCLVWSVIDARAPIAAGALVLGQLLSLLGFYLPGWVNGRSENLVLLSTYLLLTVALVGVGAALVRRRAAL